MPVAAGLYYIFHDRGPLDKPPIVLIHGAGGDHLGWPLQLRRFPGRRVLTVDLSGHGRSEGHARQSIEAYEKQIAAFLDELQIYRVILVGHSMGAAVAMQTALDIPRQVVGLGLISSGPSLSIVPDLYNEIQTPVSFEKIARKLIKRLYSHKADQRLVRKGFEHLCQLRRSGLYADWKACHRFDIENQLGSIEVPTWIVVGKEDEITPYYESQKLNRLIKDSTLEIIPDAGHMVILEQPESVARSFSLFLKGLPALKKYAWQHPEMN